MNWQDEIMLKNVKQNPHYSPYCGRCRGLVRMEIVGHTEGRYHWACKCGAEHVIVLTDEKEGTEKQD